MKNYIKPSANVIELAVKETLSRSSVRQRSYNVKIGNNTTRDVTVDTNIYTANSVSNIDLRQDA